ncbi:DNA primase [Yersinia ruckeri]|uniref:DNA primase n=1 Tax=Yersinia ruckeri TaxID=29486 RepID=UPI001F3462EC|nr:DNA primase [Yersinia ruckeri]EKN4704980.1 DNA primase [Yersinia ruckeri]UIN08469.1 DNA primase [Yersinia ruckeri]
MAKIKGFSHLFGRGAKASEENEEDKDKDKEKSKKAKGRHAEEDEDQDDNEDEEKNGKKAKGRRAESDDDDQDEKDPDAEDDSDDADADEGEDDDGDDEDEDRNVKKGRRAERKRCARIFGSKHAAAGRVDLAASLALNSGMSSAAVIRVLASTSAATPAASTPRKRSLDERMQALGHVQVGQDAADAPSGSAQALVSKMTGLYNQTVGKKS